MQSVLIRGRSDTLFSGVTIAALPGFLGSARVDGQPAGRAVFGGNYCFQTRSGAYGLHGG